jgi:transcriptional regulator NrdR family protein
MNCPLCKGYLRNITVSRETEGVSYNAPAEQCQDCGEIFSGWRAGLAELRALKRASEKNPEIRWTEKQEGWLQRLTIKEATS